VSYQRTSNTRPTRHELSLLSRYPKQTSLHTNVTASLALSKPVFEVTCPNAIAMQHNIPTTPSLVSLHRPYASKALALPAQLARQSTIPPTLIAV
jgi:hypothetical protein